MAQRRLTLTTRGALALGTAPVIAVVGAVLGAEELVLLAIALATMLGCGFVQSAYRAAVARTNWRVTTELAGGDAEVGGPLALTVTLAAAGRGAAVPTWLEDPRTGWSRVRRAGSPSGVGSPARVPARLPSPSVAVRVPQLDSGGTAQFRFAAPTESRGVFTRRGLRLWCFDSFGLVANVVATGPSTTITVHPVPSAVALTADLLVGEPGADLQLPPSSVRPRRDSFGDFSGVRPYVPGDRLRLLYWPALARTGELMVRDFDDAGPHRVRLVADVRPLLGDIGLERVLAAAAGVGLQVLAQGSILEFSTTAGEQLAIGPGPMGEQALLRALAGMEGGTGAASSSSRWRGRGRRRPFSPPPGAQEFHAVSGTPLMITTAEGARAMPDALGFAHLVMAP
jgi:uncharacterized protein (DUF58 family)